MTFKFTPYILPLLLNAILTLGLVVYLWRRRSTREVVPLSALLLGISFWSATYGLELLGADIPTKLLWARVEYFGIVALPFAWFHFANRFRGSRESSSLSSWMNITLFLISVLILLMVWLPSLKNLIWRDLALREVGPFLTLDINFGPGFWMVLGYCYLIFIYGSYLILKAAISSTRLRRNKMLILLVAVLAPLLGSMVYVFDITPLTGLDYSPFAFTISGLALSYVMLSHNLTGLIPIARSTMIENMQSGVIVLDQFQQVEYINTKAKSLLELEGNVEGFTIQEVCPHWSQFQEFLQGDTYEPYSGTVKCARNGATKWFDITLSPLPDRFEVVIGHLMMFQDITLRHREREELRKLRQAVEASGEAIFMTDPDGVFTYINPQFTTLYGYTPEEIVGTKTPRLLESDQRSSEEYDRYWRNLHDKKVVQVEFVNKTKAGDLLHVEGSTNPILDEDRELLGFLGIRRDVTEAYQAKQTLQGRLRDLTFLNQLAEAGVKTVDEDLLIQNATQLVGRIFNPDYFGILLIDDDERYLYLHSSYEAHGGRRDVSISLGEGITGHVAQTGEAWYVPDVSKEPAYISAELDIRSELCVPLNTGDRVIGVINMESERVEAFDEADLNLLTTFADQLAIAMERARLFKRAEQLAITDELTGLYNRRHFFDLAKTEFARARRYQHPLGVMMLDVDHFKRVNDTYGHAVGDAVLAKIARRLKDNCRKVDILARYGGEEFSLILPETELSAVLDTAERLRGCIAHHAIDTGDESLSVTISLGVTALSKNTPDLSSLINQADQALLLAKSAGRNCVRSS